MDILLVPLTALAFAMSSPATVVALRNLSVPWVVVGRCLVAGLGLELMLRLRPRARGRKLRRREGLLAAAAGAVLALHLILFVAGLANTSFTAAVSLVALEPVAVLVAGILFFANRPRPLQLAGTALAIAGALVIGLKGGEPQNAQGATAHHWSGDLMELGAVACFGIYYALNRLLATSGASKEAAPSLASAVVIYAVAAGVGLLLTIPGLAPAPPPGGGGLTNEALIAIVVLGLVPTLIGHTSAQIAARRLAPAIMGLVSPGETLGSLAIGVVALGARPSSVELFGACIIVLGALTVTLGTASVSSYAEDLHQSR